MTVLFRGALQTQRHFSWCSHRRVLSTHETVCQWCRVDMYLLVFLAAFVVAIAEFWASARTHSLSLWSDAWHVFSDGMGYGIAGVYAFVVSRRLATPYRQGQVRRYSEYCLGALLLAAVANIVANVMAAVWLGRMPSIRETETLLFVASLGLCANIYQLTLLYFFRAVDHSGHNHARQSGEKMLAANFWHTVGDMASSLLVVFNAVMMHTAQSRTWVFLDVAASAVIAGILFWQSLRLFSSEASNS